MYALKSLAILVLAIMASAPCWASTNDGFLKIYFEEEQVEEMQGKKTVSVLPYIKSKLFSAKKSPFKIMNSAADADFVLRAASSRSDGKWHEGWLTIRGERARATVEVVDSCGNLVWMNAAGDRSARLEFFVGPFSKKGPKKVADRIVKRLIKSVRDGEFQKAAFDNECN